MSVPPAQPHAEPHPLRAIPSVDRVLREIGPTPLPRPAVLAVVRRVLEQQRQRIAADSAEPADILQMVRIALDDLHRSRIRPVINATGIIIHTNLGRSPLAATAADAVHRIASSYNNLEYDLAAGDRGRRGGYVEHNLAVLCGSEAATVVNNCAAALVLMLHQFARPPRDQVIISRGELVQIGGGFRIPEILSAAGAPLCEVGTTNRTTLADYQAALSERAGLILRVHRSNFYMGGFVEEPASADIAALARSAKVPFVEDLGSGATFATEDLGGGEHEPTPLQAIAGGATLVCFSGDKLLGGPQAGIIAGTKRHVAALKANPLFRALRCDKLVLTALQETVDLLLDEQHEPLPIRAMMRADLDQLRQRAQRLVAAVAETPLHAAVGEGFSQVGGGSLPRTQLPSLTVDLKSDRATAQQLAKLLRLQATPVIGYVTQNLLRLDLRTVFPQQDELLLQSLRQIASSLSTVSRKTSPA